MTTKLSVFILAYNSEDKIEGALKSVQWVDEVVVIDSHSVDRTAEIAAKYGAKVVQVDFEGFGKLRLAGIANTTHDWIFSLDTDERCTTEAQEEIQRIIQSGDAADAYHTPRRNYFMGREIKHSGFYPDYRQPQLFKRGKMTFPSEDLVHEGYELEGRLDYMENAIVQIPFLTLSEVLEKANRYSTLSAQKLSRKSQRTSGVGAFIHGLIMFLKMYVFKLGILDGFPGFVLALSNFEGTFYKYAKLAEMNQKQNHSEEGKSEFK